MPSDRYQATANWIFRVVLEDDKNVSQNHPSSICLGPAASGRVRFVSSGTLISEAMAASITFCRTGTSLTLMVFSTNSITVEKGEYLVVLGHPSLPLS